MFGGSGLAAAIAALEATSARAVRVGDRAVPVVRASPARCVDIDVTIAVEGHQITQARAVCHVADREILTVNAALGDRPLEASGQWETMPEGIPRPDDCPVRPHMTTSPGRSARGSTSAW